jgi:hypothetical protein
MNLPRGIRSGKSSIHTPRSGPGGLPEPRVLPPWEKCDTLGTVKSAFPAAATNTVR